MSPSPPVAPRRSRLWRWVWALVALLAVLAVYAVVLERVSVRLEHDVQKSLRASPDTGDRAHRPD